MSDPTQMPLGIATDLPAKTDNAQAKPEAPAPHLGFNFGEIALNVLIDRSGDTPTPYFIPREVGEAIGYAKPEQVAKRISERWRDDLVEGSDYERLSHAELLEKFRGPKVGPLDFPNRGMILLSEQGLYGVLMLARAPKARDFRKWVRSEVLPQIARDGSYSPHREIDEQGRLRIKEAELALEKARLELQAAQVRAQEVDAQDRAAKAKALEGIIDCVEDLGPDAVRALRMRSAELLTGEDLSQFKPRLAAVHTPTSMAADFGVTPRRVGMIITKLGLRGDPERSQAILNTKAHSDGHVKSWLYDDEAYVMIEKAIDAWHRGEG